jgi:hypothetical protein
MTVEQIKELHFARPFRPFIMHLADGRSFEVNHPEFLSYSRSGRILHFVTPQDHQEHIELLMVVSVEEESGRTRARRRKAG